MSMNKLLIKDFFLMLGIKADGKPCDLDYVWGDTSNDIKIKFLCDLTKSKFSDKKVLEIGTYRGATSCSLVKNLSSGHLYTCDCTFETLKKYLKEESEQHKDIINYSSYEVGSAYEQHLTECERHKLTQLIGDTRDLDFQQRLVELAPFDLIYIDASHTGKGVENDTKLALSILSNDGMIVWDDYGGWWTGVTEYLDKLAISLDLTYIIDGRYVVYSLD